MEYLPDDRFGVLGEIEDCSWEVTRQREDDDSGDEDGYGKRAMDGNDCLPRVSTDYEVGDTTLLDKIEDTFGPIREW